MGIHDPNGYTLASDEWMESAGGACFGRLYNGLLTANTETDTTAVGSGPWCYRIELE